MGTHRFTFFSDSQPAPAATLTYTTVRHDAEAVGITFSGEIDMATSDEVVAAVTTALSSHGPRTLYVDLAEVRFMDSSGINALVRCRACVAERGCRLVVTNPQPIVYRVLEITGVLEALAVTPGPAAAEPVETVDRPGTAVLPLPAGAL